MWATTHPQFMALSCCSTVCSCVAVWCVGKWSERQTSKVPIMKLLTTNWHLQMSHAILSIHKGKLNKKPPSPPKRHYELPHTTAHTPLALSIWPSKRRERQTDGQTDRRAVGSILSEALHNRVNQRQHTVRCCCCCWWCCCLTWARLWVCAVGLA